jgi:hypothetical protein
MLIISARITLMVDYGQLEVCNIYGIWAIIVSQ